MSAAQRTRFEGVARTLELAFAGLDGCCEQWTADRVDPARCLPTAGMDRVRREVEAAVARAEGPVLLSGPTGHGKSLLLRRLAEAPPPGFLARFLPFANLEPADLCLWLAALSGRGRPRDPEAALDELLATDSLSHTRVLVLVDEVQAMPRETGRWLAERVERSGAGLLMAGLPGPGLDALLAGLPPSTRVVPMCESWQRRDAELLLACLEESARLEPGELAAEVDAESAVRAARGNPRLVLREIAEHVRAARLGAEIARAAARASAPPPPAPASALPELRAAQVGAAGAVLRRDRLSAIAGPLRAARASACLAGRALAARASASARRVDASAQRSVLLAQRKTTRARPAVRRARACVAARAGSLCASSGARLGRMVASTRRARTSLATGPALAGAAALVCALVLASDGRRSPTAGVEDAALASIASGGRELAALTAPTSPTAHPVTVQVNAHPWAVISVDGRRLGATPFSVSLEAGVHRFRAELSDGRVVEREERVSGTRHRVAFP